MAEGYYHSKESVEQYISMTKGMNGMMLIIELEKHLKPGASILEFGTGPGNDYDILSHNYKITGSDLSEEFLSRLKHRFPQGEFLKLNAAKFETTKKYDAIYSNKVLHHLSNEELKRSILSQHESLDSDGIVCHSFWKGNGTENYNGLFVNNHTEETLRQHFSHKFDIIDMIPYKEFENDDSLILLARKTL